MSASAERAFDSVVEGTRRRVSPDPSGSHSRGTEATTSGSSTTAIWLGNEPDRGPGRPLQVRRLYPSQTLLENPLICLLLASARGQFHIAIDQVTDTVYISQANSRFVEIFEHGGRPPFEWGEEAINGVAKLRKGIDKVAVDNSHTDSGGTHLPGSPLARRTTSKHSTPRGDPCSFQRRRATSKATASREPRAARSEKWGGLDRRQPRQHLRFRSGRQGRRRVRLDWNVRANLRRCRRARANSSHSGGCRRPAQRERLGQRRKAASSTDRTIDEFDQSGNFLGGKPLLNQEPAGAEVRTRRPRLQNSHGYLYVPNYGNLYFISTTSNPGTSSRSKSTKSRLRRCRRSTMNLSRNRRRPPERFRRRSTQTTAAG